MRRTRKVPGGKFFSVARYQYRLSSMRLSFEKAIFRKRRGEKGEKKKLNTYYVFYIREKRDEKEKNKRKARWGCLREKSSFLFYSRLFGRYMCSYRILSQPPPHGTGRVEMKRSAPCSVPFRSVLNVPACNLVHFIYCSNFHRIFSEKGVSGLLLAMWQKIANVLSSLRRLRIR